MKKKKHLHISGDHYLHIYIYTKAKKHTLIIYLDPPSAIFLFIYFYFFAVVILMAFYTIL